ncbi:nSTAND1 domain-containing NTPase [Alcaligenes aquatilis]|uniref:nSTAND1 domain-containing NTPase n=1 Tax=Alcaligenes aquatilis TaxID=323284 RepID=UPI003620125C
MHNLYEAELKAARSLASDAEKLGHLSSILRSLLQTAAVCAIEIVQHATPAFDSEVDLNRFIDRFSQPSDGLPVELLDTLVPFIRGLVSRQYFRGWFEPIKEHEKPLVTELGEWLVFRNKRLGHGVVDGPMATFWATKTDGLINRILEDSAGVVPAYNNGELVISVGDVKVQLTTPLVLDSLPLVITKIAPTRGIWKLHAQLLSLTNAREVMADLSPNSVFCNDEPKGERFKWTDVPVTGGTSSVLHNVPVRQTATFVGRKKELEKLGEWFEQVEDYRTCLVFGDGGYGKTTLVLEFFNNLIEEGFDTKVTLPTVISFYTAKRTRWSEDGLLHIKGMADAMEDSVRELMYCFEPVLGREWYKMNGRALIDKAAAELREQGLTRDDVLLIIDNTETLATSSVDAEELADFLARIARTVGRVVITSRRREMLAAFPVPVSQLSEAEALALMQQLGKVYAASAIQQSSEPKLRRACQQLMYKPLLIDTLIRYIARSASSVQDGLDQILKKTNDQLLEFLYEDAWHRMTTSVKEVFMVLVMVDTPIDGRCVGDVCTEIGVQHSEFQASLGETYFASIVDHGDTYDLEIVALAKEFFRQKKRRLIPMEAERLENIAFRVDKLATERFEITKNYRLDRVADAFRSEFAKAAKIATFKREYKSARELFELAMQEEPLNAALRERFASFLFRTLNDPNGALPLALEASELDPTNPDAWLTLGLIQYKLGDLLSGDNCMKNAQMYGKAASLCLLRKAIARYHTANREPYAHTSIRYLKEAATLVDLSQRASSKEESSKKDFYSEKNQREAEKYAVLIRTLTTKIGRREVSSKNAPEGR